MSRRDRELERRLRELRAPDEADAEERSLEIVRAAYAEHVPLRPSRTTRRVGLGLACGVVALAIGLSPAGAKVGDLVSDVFDPEPAGEPNAKPELRSLPAPGSLLVRSEGGIWVVREDGSKRLLGDYAAASWSPRARYVIAGQGRTLTALTSGGDVRWTFPTRGTVRDPRWAGSAIDTRIAYRSGDDLRVIAGDGNPESDRLLARNVAAVAPAWRPGRFVVAYVLAEGGVRAVEAESGRHVAPTRSDRRRLSPDEDVDRALSPSAQQLALVEHAGASDRLLLSRRGGGTRDLFFARSRLVGPTWSPDGRWILIGWPAADQWLFVDPKDPKNVLAFGRIAEQFTPGAPDPRFPRVLAWASPPPG